MAAGVEVIGHPLVQHKLTLLRRKTTSTVDFRRLLDAPANIDDALAGTLQDMAKRAFAAMMTMRKIDVAAIEAARRG